MPGEGIGNTGQFLPALCHGIYSSPDPSYAAHYMRRRCQGSPHKERLIVCATLMGLSFNLERGSAWERANAHSHISGDGKEYVVFDSSQIIPCYVLHLDTGDQPLPSSPWLKLQKTLKDHPRLSLSTKEISKERRAKKQALAASGAKWFPYG